VKKWWRVPVLVTLLLGAAAAGLGAQSETRKTQVLFGPRLGASVAVMGQPVFNNAMQLLFRDDEKDYFPIFTQMGFEAEQLLPLGDSLNALTVSELFLLGGLDQGLALPNGSLIIGFRSAGGFEAGLGPYVTIVAPEGELRLAAAVVYAIGYDFPMKGFSLPITLTMVPLPSYSNPQITILAGFNFPGVD